MKTRAENAYASEFSEVSNLHQSYIVMRLFALCSLSSFKKYVTFKVKK